MRILTGVLSQGYGGAERNALHIAGRLAERGHEVHFYFTAGNRIGQEAKESGLPLLPVKHRLKYLSPNAILKLVGYMNRHKFDVIHSNDWHSLGGIVAPAVAMTKSRPAFVNTRRIGCGAPKKDLYHRWTFAQLDAFLVLSAKMADDARQNFAIAPDIIKILYNAVDLDMYSGPQVQARGQALRAAWNVGPDDLLILCAGRLLPEKRQSQLITGLAPLLGQDKGIRLVIAGEADSADYQAEVETSALGVQQQTKTGDSQKSVLLPGFIHDIPAAMQAADVVVMPSLNEAFGMVLIEGMAAGCVPIATPNEATGEIIEHGVDGFIVPAPEGPELLEAVSTLRSNRVLREEMAARAVQKVRDRFDRDRQVDDLEKLYVSLVANKPG